MKNLCKSHNAFLASDSLLRQVAAAAAVVVVVVVVVVGLSLSLARFRVCSARRRTSSASFRCAAAAAAADAAAAGHQSLINHGEDLQKKINDLVRRARACAGRAPRDRRRRAARSSSS